MIVNDPIGDMLTRIRNGQLALKTKVLCPNSKNRRVLLDILRDEGYIRGYVVQDVRKDISNISIELKYSEGKPVIEAISRISKPGRRVYSAASKIGTVHSGLGISILSTSNGMMTDIDAKAKGIGGEVVCKVF
jgi:small subunit ribosomal protein S8